jgi:uncharacterized membrane protein
MAKKKRPPGSGYPATQNSAQRSVTLTESFAGPLPPPKILEQYNVAVPGGAERILVMAEKQAVHRQTLERIALTSNGRRETLGQICGVVVSLAAIAGGVILIMYDKSAAGLTAILTPLAGLVFTFIYGKRIQRSELAGKKFF